jgi:Protein of unknown function (DUF1524)
MRKHLIVAVGAVAVAVTASVGAAGFQAGQVVTKNCSSSYATAKLSWGTKCLRAGEVCKVGNPEYRAYGFICPADARLSHLQGSSGQSSTSTAATKPSAATQGRPTPARAAAGSYSGGAAVWLRASARAAVRRLARLLVRPAGSMSGYGRDKFGPAWEDVNDNGCDTRNDILRRDLTRIVLEPGSTGTVLRGRLHDPYTGETIAFLRGVGTSTEVQIDHVVALGDAWMSGAASWTATRRLDYANDPLVLLAVDGPENEAKGDDDASEWLPPNRAYDCAYVKQQIAIKTKYQLAVSPAEKLALSRTLKSCH